MEQESLQLSGLGFQLLKKSWRECAHDLRTKSRGIQVLYQDRAPPYSAKRSGRRERGWKVHSHSECALVKTIVEKRRKNKKAAPERRAIPGWHGEGCDPIGCRSADEGRLG